MDFHSVCRAIFSDLRSTYWIKVREFHNIMPWHRFLELVEQRLDHLTSGFFLAIPQRGVLKLNIDGWSKGNIEYAR